MKKKIAGILVGVLLIGIVSAGLVGYLSNMVSANVGVEGPVFYAGANHNLLINEFTGGSSTPYLISGKEEELFNSEEVDRTNFYAPKLNLSVEAYLWNGTSPKLLDLEFGYYTTFNDGINYPFCKVTINVTSSDSEVYSNICNGNSTNQLEGFYYSVKGRGTGDVQIKVKTYYGETKVQVLGVAD